MMKLVNIFKGANSETDNKILINISWLAFWVR